MAVKIGNTTPTKFFVGNTQVQKLYRGSQLLYTATAVIPNAVARTIDWLGTRGSETDQYLTNRGAATDKIQLGSGTGTDAYDPIYTAQGIYFDGTKYLMLDTAEYLAHSNNFTMLMFINPAALQNSMVLSISNTLNLKLTSGGKFRIEYKDTSSTYFSTDGPSYSANTRYILSVRKSSTSGLKLYVNKVASTFSAQTGNVFYGVDSGRMGVHMDTTSVPYTGAMQAFYYVPQDTTDAQFDALYARIEAEVQATFGLATGAGAPSTTSLGTFFPTISAVSAKSFQEATTIAGHIERYTDTEWATLKNKIAEGNFAVFRAAWSNTREINRAKELGALGVKLIVGVDPVGGTVPRQYNSDGSAGSDPYWYSTGSGQFRYIDQLIDAIGPQYIAAVAGTNEPNVFIMPKRRNSQASNYVYGGGGAWDVSPSGAKFADYVQTFIDLQKDTWRTIRSRSDFNHIKILGASWTSVDYFTQQGSLGAFMDAGNAHAYFGGRPVETGPWGGNGYASVSDYFIPKMTNVVKPGGPHASDEGGISSSEVYRSDTGVTNEALRGKYLMRFFMDLHRKGLRYVITSYELHDNTANVPAGREETFGVLYNNMSDKVSFTYLKNLFGLLKDPGVDFTTSALKFSLTGSTTDVRRHLLQKRDGSFWLAIWLGKSGQDPDTHVPITVAAQSVTVTLESAKNIQVYDPTISQSAQSTDSAVTSKVVSVTEGIKLLRIA